MLVRATTFLRDLDDLRVVIIGFGARHAEIFALATRLEADRVHFLPYQPREVLPLSLAAADLHFVGLARGLCRLRRSEPSVRDPCRGTPRDRLGRRRQRDGAGCRPRSGAESSSAPGVPSVWPRVIRDAYDGRARSRGDGSARSRIRDRGGRPERRRRPLPQRAARAHRKLRA